MAPISPLKPLIAKSLRKLRGVWLQSMLVASSPAVALAAIPVIIAMTSTKAASDDGSAMAMCFVLILYVLVTGATFLFGSAMYFLELSRDKDPGLQVIATSFTRMYDAVTAVLSYIFIVSLGGIFFVIPGFIAAMGLIMTLFAMNDHRDLHLPGALKRSWMLVWGQGHFQQVASVEVLWPIIYTGWDYGFRFLFQTLLGTWGSNFTSFLHWLSSFIVIVIILTCSWACRATLYQELEDAAQVSQKKRDAFYVT